MAYLLDANIFIQASNVHYGFDFCPAFWQWLDKSNTLGTVLSIRQVQDELAQGNDELADWAKTKGKSFFKDTDEATFSKLSEVATWIQSKNYEPSAIATFSQVADYYLTAYALAHGHTLVTHEVPADTTKKIKIPNLCLGLGIAQINPYQMLRRENVKFVLGN